MESHEWRIKRITVLEQAAYRTSYPVSIMGPCEAAWNGATLAEHKSHVEFENELYATLVDPVAEGSIKEAEMRKQLLEQARWYRQRVHDLTDFVALLKAADDGLKIWAGKNPRWWNRIDGTPIPNDLLVNVVQAICVASRAEEKETAK